MAVKTKCAHCSRVYTLADNLLGKKIKCRECDEVFEVKPIATTAVKSSGAAPQASPRPKNAVSAGPPPVRGKVVDDVEVVDDGDIEEEDERDRNRPRRSRPRRRERESSSAAIWVVGIGAGVVALVLVAVVVWLLMRSPQQALIAQAAPAVAPGANAPVGNNPPANQGAANPPGVNPPVANPPVANPPPNPGQNPPGNPGNVAAPQIAANDPVAPAGLYGDQGGDPIAPADPGLPNTVLRARAEDTFYKLSNPRIGKSTGFPPRPGPALLVDYEILRRGKHDGGALVIHGGDGRREPVSLFSLGRQDRGTIEITTFGPFGSFPQNAELYVTRGDHRWGRLSPTFKVSNSVVMGAMAVSTKARNWTKEEIDRFTKDPPNYLAANQHPNVGKDTAFVGESKKGGSNRYVEPKGYLLGLDYFVVTWEKERCIGGSMAPVFSRDQPPAPATKRVVAKDGYVVAGAEVYQQKHLNSIKLVFQKLKADGSLDANDSYTSDLIGEAAEGEPTKVATDGKPAIGFHSRWGAIVDGFALVLRE